MDWRGRSYPTQQISHTTGHNCSFLETTSRGKPLCIHASLCTINFFCLWRSSLVYQSSFSKLLNRPLLHFLPTKILRFLQRQF